MLRRILQVLLVFSFSAFAAHAIDYNKLRVICIEAHPDDCDSGFGGLAGKYAAAGHLVKIVSLTNGDMGHHEMGRGVLAQRRRAEGKEAGRRIGIEYEVLDNHDGELLPTLEVRNQVIKAIREWKADMVFQIRPNAYHPDHRYAGILVMDASYMVTVPNIVTDIPSLRRNPVFFYMWDRFKRPNAHRADVAVSIDDVISKKVDMLDAHVSQVYEWLAWHGGVLDQVPEDKAARKVWLLKTWGPRWETRPIWKDALRKRYGPRADSIKYTEAYELTEYGSQPDEAEIRRLFPFFP